MNIICKTLLLVVVSSALSFSDTATSGTIIIVFSDIKPDQGMVEVSLYNQEETFLVKDKFIQRHRAKIVNGRAEVVCDNIPFGKIAIGSYHDVDNDEIYDKNIIGLPVEPYAFSKPPVCNWRKPRFDEVAINFTHSGQIVKMKFRTFMQ